MRMLSAFAVLVAASLLATPRSAEAQFEGLLSGITDLTVNSSCRVSAGENRIRDCYDASSFGFEILWRLREIPRNGTGVASPAGRKKTGSTETMRRDPDGRVVFTEAVDTYAVVPGEDKTVTKWVILELALGYSQFAGIKADKRVQRRAAGAAARHDSWIRRGQPAHPAPCGSRVQSPRIPQSSVELGRGSGKVSAQAVVHRHDDHHGTAGEPEGYEAIARSMGEE